MKILNNNNLIKILNIIKIISLIAILAIFIYQQTSLDSLKILNITRILLFVFAGLGFSSIISTTLLKKKDSTKPFLIILITIGIIFGLLAFNVEKFILDDINTESKNAVYILLGISSLILISIFLLKQFLNKNENFNNKNGLPEEETENGFS